MKFTSYAANWLPSGWTSASPAPAPDSPEPATSAPAAAAAGAPPAAGGGFDPNAPRGGSDPAGGGFEAYAPRPGLVLAATGSSVLGKYFAALRACARLYFCNWFAHSVFILQARSWMTPSNVSWQYCEPRRSWPNKMRKPTTP